MQDKITDKLNCIQWPCRDRPLYEPFEIDFVNQINTLPRVKEIEMEEWQEKLAVEAAKKAEEEASARKAQADQQEFDGLEETESEGCDTVPDILDTDRHFESVQEEGIGGANLDMAKLNITSSMASIGADS